MLTAKELAERCLAKPGAYFDYPFGDEPMCIRVKKKIYAELYTAEGNRKITLKCEPMLAELFRQQYPGVVVRGYHCPPVQQPHRNTVWYEHIDRETLCEMIDRSYDLVVASLTRLQRQELAAETALDKEKSEHEKESGQSRF